MFEESNITWSSSFLVDRGHDHVQYFGQIIKDWASNVLIFMSKICRKFVKKW